MGACAGAGGRGQSAGEGEGQDSCTRRRRLDSPVLAAVRECRRRVSCLQSAAAGGMKQRAVCARGAEGGARRGRRVATYLAQLRRLVPLVPLDRPVSQLEVIQHVIDYIGQLEQQLESREEAVCRTPAQTKRRQPLQEVTGNTDTELSSSGSGGGAQQQLKQAPPMSPV